MLIEVMKWDPMAKHYLDLICIVKQCDLLNCR